MERNASALNVLSFSLDPRILDAGSLVALRERETGSALQKYTLIIPYPRDTEIRLSDSNVVYGIGGRNKLIQLIKIYKKARTLIQQSPYDVITVQDAYYLALAGWLIAKNYNIGFEIQAHGFEKFSGIRAFIAKKIILKADAIRTVSARLKNNLVTAFRVPEEKITIAPFFSEHAAHQPDTQLISKIISKKRNDFVFLTVARLVPVKNISLQLHSFKNLLIQYPDTQLWIVGDGPERAFLEKEAHVLGIKDRVIWWGWQSDLSAFYEYADSFILSSDSEGYGLVIFEAAAYGLSILMTDVGCAGEFIHNGENGIIVPVRNEEAFTAEMIKLRTNKELRESLGKNAKNALSALPTKEELIQKYVESWERACI
jgi:glycosyltransferase involved in cell wall biosynthesis